MTSEDVKIYLMMQYQKRGNVDFYFGIKQLSRKLNKKTQVIGHALSELQEEGVVRRYNKKTWFSTFNEKNKEPEPVLKKRWWKLFN